MNLERIFTRTFEIMREHYYLIAFGVVIALFGSGGGGASGSGSNFSQGFPQTGSGTDFQMPSTQELWAIIAPYIAIGIAVFCVLMVLGLILWVLVVISRGALIGGVNAIENGQNPGLMGSWQLGTQRAPKLLILALIADGPIMVVTLGTILAFLGVFFGLGEPSEQYIGIYIAVLVIPLLCIVAPLSIVLTSLHHFAVRALMIEGIDGVAAYQRAWAIIRQNFSQVALLWIIQAGLSIVIAIIMIIPTIIFILCCVLIPLLWVISGAINTYFNTLWTLAYREWVGTTGQPQLTD